MDRRVNPSRDTDSSLHGPEVPPGVRPYFFQKAFSRKPPIDFSDGDRSDATIRLRYGDQPGPGHYGSDCGASLPSSKQSCHLC